MLISFIENPPGCVFPVHSHPSEQILVILEGEEEHICGDEKFLMKAGDLCIHPSNVPHGGETKTGFKGIDIFCPPREDHVEKLKNPGGDGEEKRVEVFDFSINVQGLYPGGVPEERG